MPPARLRAMLHQAPLAFIATASAEQPFVHPNLFWYDEAGARIYFHTADQGRTRDNIRQNPNVCLCVAELGRLLPAQEALQFSCQYASVMVFGRAHLVQDEGEARRGLQGLLDKYFPQLKPERDYRAITAQELARTSVFALQIESWSGKEKRAAP